MFISTVFVSELLIYCFSSSAADLPCLFRSCWTTAFVSQLTYGVCFRAAELRHLFHSWSTAFVSELLNYRICFTADLPHLFQSCWPPVFSHESVILRPHGVRSGFWPLDIWDHWFDSHLRHGRIPVSFCLFLSCVGGVMRRPDPPFKDLYKKPKKFPKSHKNCPQWPSVVLIYSKYALIERLFL
jgi:hypothetical protein